MLCTISTEAYQQNERRRLRYRIVIPVLYEPSDTNVLWVFTMIVSKECFHMLCQSIHYQIPCAHDRRGDFFYRALLVSKLVTNILFHLTTHIKCFLQKKWLATYYPYKELRYVLIIVLKYIKRYVWNIRMRSIQISSHVHGLGHVSLWVIVMEVCML